jgi:hypothetical protein
VLGGDAAREIDPRAGTNRPPGDDQTRGCQASQDLTTFRLDLLAIETAVINGNG